MYGFDGNTNITMDDQGENVVKITPNVRIGGAGNITNTASNSSILGGNNNFILASGLCSTKYFSVYRGTHTSSVYR